MAKECNTYQIDELYPALDGACHLLVGCRKGDYSASRIARAVEDCDAHLLNLNAISGDGQGYDMLVDLRVAVANGELVARSLERYGYEVIDVEPVGVADDSTLKQRIDELLRYLNI